jgi:hypothetical protein
MNVIDKIIDTIYNVKMKHPVIDHIFINRSDMDKLQKCLKTDSNLSMGGQIGGISMSFYTNKQEIAEYLTTFYKLNHRTPQIIIM